MADTTKVDGSTPDGAGDNQSPVSQNSGQPIAGTPQNSQELLDLKKTIGTLEKELRGLQSRQDKDKTETQRFMDEVKQQVAKGLTLEQAEQAVTESRKAQEKDDLLVRIAQKLGLESSSPTQTAGTGANVTNEATQTILQKAGLDANSVEVLDLIQKHGSNPVDFAMSVGELKARQANKPSPSATASPAIQSAATSQSSGTEALISELNQLQLMPTKNRARINELAAELDKRGWK